MLWVFTNDVDGDTSNMNFLQRSCSKKSNNMMVNKTLVLNKFLWKVVITWNKKHLSKQFISMTYILKKNFYAAATFKGLRVLYFQKE